MLWWVAGSILLSGARGGRSFGRRLSGAGQTRGSSSVVERQLPKLNVAGSNPVSRSILQP